MKKLGVATSIAVLLVLFIGSIVTLAQDLPNITGGEEVGQGAYPSTVYLNMRGTQFGGVLIDEEWILTCAHCLDNEIPASKALAQIGGIDKIVADEEGETIVRGIKKVIHPDYDPVTHEYDLAMLKIPKIAESEDVKIARIYTGNAEINVFVPLSTTVSGWGKTELVEDVRYLRATNFQYVCRITGETTMSCRDPYNPGRGVCYGDSGSPLEIYTEEGRKLHSLVGGGNPCDDERRQGEYTKVGTEKVLAWIDSVINAPVYELYVPYLYGQPVAR